MKIGHCRIKAEGGAANAFLGALCNKNISVYNIKKQKDGVIVECTEKDKNDVFNAAAYYGMVCYVQKTRSFEGQFRSLSGHFGIITGIIFAMIAIILSQTLLWGIDVAGVDEKDSEAILSYLEQNGIDRAIPLGSIDCEELEKNILALDEDFAFAEVYTKGNRLQISVKTQLEENTPQEYNGAIYSSHDAIVTRVEVSGGTALVKAGDTVRQGQQLIGDYIIIGNPEDPAHTEEHTAAKGDVYGRVWYSARLVIPDKIIKAVRTGRTFTSSSLYIGDLCVLKASEKHGFDTYEAVTHVSESQTLLPYSLHTTTYYEVRYQEIEATADYINSVICEAQNELYREIPEAAKLTDSGKFQKKVDNLYIINIYYEVEQLISCREE